MSTLKPTKVEKNRMVQVNIIKLENERTWISHTTSIGRKMTLYKALFSQRAEDGFNIRYYTHDYSRRKSKCLYFFNREKLLKNNISTTPHQQKTITTFFNFIISRHWNEFRIDQIIAMCCAWQPQPFGPRPITLILDKLRPASPSTVAAFLKLQISSHIGATHAGDFSTA